MIALLKELCALNGVSSNEDAVRDFIRAKIESYADNVRVDALGNLIVFKKGAVSAPNKLMITAHMDEVGFMVSAITDDGYLKFDRVGGIDGRVVLGKRVVVGANCVPGVIGLKAYHLVSLEEEKIVPKVDDMYIDIGANTKAEAEAMVSLGDYVAFDGDVLEFGDGMLKAKAIDDRVGCAAMVQLLKRDLPMDCTFVFSVQEEVGLRGAFGAAFSVSPEIALVLEGTTAADLPRMDEHKKVTSVGKGPVLGVMDNGVVYDRPLFEQLRDLAKTNEIPWQVKQYISGGNDSGAIQRCKNGIRVASISVAVRYLHTPTSVASVSDCHHVLTLTQKFMEAIAASSK